METDAQKKRHVMKMIGTRPEAVIKALKAATKNEDEEDEEDHHEINNNDQSRSDIEN